MHVKYVMYSTHVYKTISYEQVLLDTAFPFSCSALERQNFKDMAVDVSPWLCTACKEEQEVFAASGVSRQNMAKKTENVYQNEQSSQVTSEAIMIRPQGVPPLSIAAAVEVAWQDSFASESGEDDGGEVCVKSPWHVAQGLDISCDAAAVRGRPQRHEGEEEKMVNKATGRSK